jgi:hypothetical protein
MFNEEKMPMKTKPKTAKLGLKTVRRGRAAPRRAVAKQVAAGKPRFKDAAARFMYEHCGALGKDYDLEY